jgi:Na+-driven multidrug efflux pump
LFGTTALAGYGIASRLDYILIPILFGISSAVLTMVGVNVGAGQIARAKRIAWNGSFMGLAITGAIGLTVAIFPALWLNLFTHDPEVLRDGVIYLRIVAPVYGAFGFGFAITFAAQGAGQMLWPFIAVGARLLLAAGGGWIVVRYFHGDIATLAMMVATSLVVYAMICAYAMVSGGVMRDRNKV